MDNPKQRRQIPLAFILLLVLPCLIWSQEFMELPKPNSFVNKNIPRSKLKVVNEILPDFDKKLFFAIPHQMAVNKQHEIFVFDIKLGSLFFFNNQCGYVNQALSRGQGPFQTVTAENNDIYAAGDGTVYVHDGMGERVMQFSNTGKPLREKRLNRINASLSPFRPVVDRDGSLFTISSHNGIVDKYDKNFKFVRSYLDKNLMDKFIFYRLPYEKIFKKYKRFLEDKIWLFPNTFNAFYDVTANNLLIIYLSRSSSVYIFDKDKLVRKFDVFPDLPLLKFKEDLIKEIKERKKRGIHEKTTMEPCIFFGCFLDKDANFIYFQASTADKENSLYQYDFTGRLIRIYSNCDHHVFFKARVQDNFYGLSVVDMHPVIFKVVKEEYK